MISQDLFDKKILLAIDRVTGNSERESHDYTSSWRLKQIRVHACSSHVNSEKQIRVHANTKFTC